MRLRNWLLTGTSLGMLALAPINIAHAQDAELTTAYQAYVTAQQSGDASATEAAQTALQEQCIVAGFATLEDCIAALAAQTGVTPPPAPAEAPAAEAPAAEAPAAEAPAAEAPAAEAPPAEAPPVEQPATEAPPVEQPAAEAPPAEQPAAEPAPVEQPAAEAPAPAPAEQAPDVLAELTQAVADYNAGVALIDQGNADAGNQQIASAQAKITELCTTAGIPDVNACLANFGLTLNPLPPAPAEAAPAAPEATPEATPPAAEPAPEAAPAAAPAAEPVAEEAAPLANPEEEQLKQLIQAVDDYNAGATLIDQGNTDQGKPQTDAAMVKITELCTAAGYPDVTVCLDTFGLTLNPLPGAPAAPATETPPPPAVDEAAANAAVTPEATEVLPETVAPEEAAPILDSSKDEETLVDSGEAPAEPAAPVAEEAPAPAPTNDQDAQAQITPPAPDQQSVEAEQGTKIADFVFVEPTPAENAPVVQQVNNAFIFQVNFQLVINNPQQERDRIYDADEDEIYYEELSRGRVRETIVRPNGVRIVTIRNRYGDVLKRSRFTPDGREYVLAAYNEDEEDGDFIVWRDPGDELPPLRLTISAREYILDADYADEEEVEDFFRQPPVEQVRRIYSVEEVKRSARIRDTVRRLEVGGLTFDSGKATISRDQVASLSKVAKAMLKLLDANPAETFLIEGHTDAVGGDVPNLALSDDRAATIARILSDFYDIPAENLVTQGYGERYLKVKTEEAERLNRRVTIKRITPLVTYTGSN